MATFRKRNGKWQAQVRRAGLTAVSRTFVQKSDAANWARSQEHSIDVCDLPASRHRHYRVRDLLTRYEQEVIPLKRADSSEDYMLRVIGRYGLADRTLGTLRASDLTDFRDRRLKEVKPATVARQLRVLLHLFKVAKDEWGLPVPLHEMQRVRIPSAPVIPVERVTNSEVTRFLVASETQQSVALSVCIKLALYTGMRRGELLSLCWEDVDLAARRLLVRTAKNGHPRMIPLSAEAIEVFETVRAIDGRVIGTSVAALKLSFARARRASKTTFRFHDLRHEAISRLFERGLTIPEVQLISGHRTMSQLGRYSHPDVFRVAAKLAVRVVE